MRYRKYTEEVLRGAVENSISFIEVLRYLGIRAGGGPQAHITRMIRQFDIDHSHFTHRARTRTDYTNERLTAEQIFRILPEGNRRLDVKMLRRALKEMGVKYECSKCGLGEIWQDKFIQLEINHIDGDWMNCLFENLEYICPNCHSQEHETNRPYKNFADRSYEPDNLDT